MRTYNRNPQARPSFLDGSDHEGSCERRAGQGPTVRVGEDRQMVAVA